MTFFLIILALAATIGAIFYFNSKRTKIVELKPRTSTWTNSTAYVEDFPFTDTEYEAEDSILTPTLVITESSESVAQPRMAKKSDTKKIAKK